MEYENINKNNEQVWQAYLYIHGAMTPAESLEFEQKLVASVELCDLLSEVAFLDELLERNLAEFEFAEIVSGSDCLKTSTSCDWNSRSAGFPGVMYAPKQESSSTVGRVSQVKTGRPRIFLTFASISLGIVAVVGLGYHFLSHEFAVKLSKNDALLHPLTVQEMSGMIGVWLNKPAVISNEPLGSALVDLASEEADSMMLISESSSEPEIPEWLLVALQVDEHEISESDEI